MSGTGGPAHPVPFVEKFFKHDRLARQAMPLFVPELRASDLTELMPGTIGPRIAELGDSLYYDGSLPGWPTWDPEESLEVVASVKLFKEAIKVFSSIDWDRLIQQAARKAEAGYLQMGKLVPRLAALRWAVGIKWVAARTAVVARTSVGGGLGTIDQKLSYQAMYDVKLTLFNWLKEICEDPAVLVMYDFDLLGHGVWHTGGHEPLPTEAEDQWYRRGAIFDLSILCLQATQLPPEELNLIEPLIELKKPFGTPNWKFPPYEGPRYIMEKHGWIAELMQAPFSDMPAKALRQGWVLHMEKPPDFEHDLTDPAIIEKIQRGDDLGKGPQEDHLPGAIHGSIGLLYACTCFKENIDHIRFYAGVLQLEGFVEAFLRYVPKLRSLDFSDNPGLITDHLLQLVPLAGPSIKILDFEACELGDDRVIDMLNSLEGLQSIDYLDLADNCITANGAELLLTGLCEKIPSPDYPNGEKRRTDLTMLRLDGNPLGDRAEFSISVARILGERGEQVSGGGQLVLQLGDGAAFWNSTPKENTLAHTLLDTGDMIDAWSFKEIKQHQEANLKALKKREVENPQWAKISGAQDWLAARRSYHDSVIRTPIMQFWRRNVALGKNAEAYRLEINEKTQRISTLQDELTTTQQDLTPALFPVGKKLVPGSPKEANLEAKLNQVWDELDGTFVEKAALIDQMNRGVMKQVDPSPKAATAGVGDASPAASRFGDTAGRGSADFGFGDTASTKRVDFSPANTIRFPAD